MSDYTYASYTTYLRFFADETDPWLRHIHNDEGGIIADPKNGLVDRIRLDSTFQVTEVVIIQTSPNSSATLSYEGTVTLPSGPGGAPTLHPVFEDGVGNLYVFSQSPDPLPSTLDVTTIQDNAPYAFPACFLAGTHIATPAGARRVETLQIGDCVLTADGRSVPILFVGAQSMMTMFALEDRLPIIISARALGDGLPTRDLIVSADHALALHGLLVNAGSLVNGRTIRPATRADVGAELTYYNIETEAHEVILAEGAGAESFVDYRSRACFHNYPIYQALYGEDRPIREMDLPRISRRSLIPPFLHAALDQAVDQAAVTERSNAA